MCVLTFIPQKNGEPIMTHNRDENVHRPEALSPQEYKIKNTTAIFPKDPVGGGTWLALSKEWSLFLLNGGFENHKRKSEYIASRGKIILTFLEHNDLSSFLSVFAPEGYEPFTFIAYQAGPFKKLVQMVWNEKELEIQYLDPATPHIWSSSTLYNAAIKAERKKIFTQFVAIQPEPKQIIDFHSRYVEGHLGQSFFVNIGNEIQTVAIVQFHGAGRERELVYKIFSDAIPASTFKLSDASSQNIGLV